MRIKIFLRIIKRTGLTKMIATFLVLFVVCSVIILLAEPKIKTFTDALWYTFVASTSIGFGDICPETHIGKIVTVLITIYEIIVAAMIPGVVVTYYGEYMKAREDDTITAFLEKLEMLPDLPKEELQKLSEKVKKFNKNK